MSEVQELEAQLRKAIRVGDWALVRWLKPRVQQARRDAGLNPYRWSDWKQGGK